MLELILYEISSQFASHSKLLLSYPAIKFLLSAINKAFTFVFDEPGFYLCCIGQHEIENSRGNLGDFLTCNLSFRHLVIIQFVYIILRSILYNNMEKA